MVAFHVSTFILLLHLASGCNLAYGQAYGPFAPFKKWRALYNCCNALFSTPLHPFKKQCTFF